jgi:hypothetical protein
VWRRSFPARFIVAVAAVLVSSAALAADALFPQPLHLTRKIEDPISQTTSTVHEYCAGNRVVTVNGQRVTFTDYAKQELTEIDRTAGTYSVTSFADLAKAAPVASPRKVTTATNATPPAPRWKSAPLGVKSSAAGRSMDAYELTIERSMGERVKIEVGVDRSVHLSRTAVEVLIGASFPNPRSDEHDAVLETAGARPTSGDRRVTTNSSATNAVEYGLPVSQVTSFEVGDERLTVRNSIVDVRSELPPDDVLTIPPGATRVESRAVRLARELRELDQLPSARQPQ